jgi:glycosyltransferase involved in cell wall biosynthesis
LITAKYHAAMVALWARRYGRLDVALYPTIQNTLSQSLPQPGRQRRVRKQYPRADRLVAISRGVATDLVEHFEIDPDRIATIPNATFDRDVEQRVQQPVDHPWLNESPPREPVILSTGRLENQKDYPTLLRAFARLLTHRAARLIILGEGSKRDELTALAQQLGIAERLHLPGMVRDPLPFMGRADLFALSSRHEGLGMVLAEALAAGSPVVSTDCPSGPREILQDGAFGRLTSVGDADALAAAMAATLDAPPAPATQREGARPYFADVVAEQYLQMMGLKAAAGNEP